MDMPVWNGDTHGIKILLNEAAYIAAGSKIVVNVLSPDRGFKDDSVISQFLNRHIDLITLRRIRADVNYQRIRGNGLPHHLDCLFQIAFIADGDFHVIAYIIIVIIAVFHNCLIDDAVGNNHAAVMVGPDYGMAHRHILHDSGNAQTAYVHLLSQIKGTGPAEHDAAYDVRQDLLGSKTHDGY